MLGVSTSSFFYMYIEMLWVRDVVGLLVKGTAFALFASLAACHEGLRRPGSPDPELVPGGGVPGDLPGRRRDPRDQQRLVHHGLPRRSGLRPDLDGPATS